MTRTATASIAIVALLMSAGDALAQNGPLDYTQWRGPNRDGSASGFVEPKAWPAELRQHWKVEVGEGYATPLVVATRIYTIARRNGNEIMMALDAATGKVVWETSYAAPYKMNPATSGTARGRRPRRSFTTASCSRSASAAS